MQKYRSEFFASCPPGLEQMLQEEIQNLGAKSTTVNRGGVQFDAFNEIALKIILYSRFASRVYKYLYSFEVYNEKEYYLEATEIKWKSLMEVEQTFRLMTIFGDLPFQREEFRNSQFANLKLKDAIVDYFRHFEGERPSVERDFPQVAFLAKIDRGVEKPYKVTLMLDLCGAPLNQRGYRISLTEAPLKENLAAAIINLVKWDPQSEDFLDAMSGSGTMAIEAALIAGDIPPSYLKVERILKNPKAIMWTFQNYAWLNKDEYLKDNFQKLMNEVNEKARLGIEKLQNSQFQFYANDNFHPAYLATQENIRKARLDKIIKTSYRDALEVKPQKNKTLFIANPPYGERLEHGEDEKLKNLYKSLGDHWKQNFKGHRAAILTGNLPLLKSVGLKTSKKHILMNGDIECRLAEYQLY
jgi:23S rRNA G2445 N2-methylase RlmL